MSSSPSQHQDISHQTQHQRWRVILVGRTGLDQLLRREGTIELIRARDPIDAIGELSDPIDADSPVQAVVLVAASIEPVGDELASFIASLRLIDHQVRVLGVGSLKSFYDGWIEPHANLEEIIDAIENAIPAGEPPALRFVDPTQCLASEPALEPIDQKQIQKPIQEPPAESEPKPEVVVVVKNENFEHRVQEPFEEESEIHKQVLMGVEPPKHPTPGIEAPISAHQIIADAPHDDGPLVEAMLAGRSILTSAIEQINARLGREDISFVSQSDVPGVPVMVADQPAGKLICDDQSWAMGIGGDLLVQQAQWLARWIKLEIQQQALRHAAFTDSLTGAWNRRYFSRFLDAAINQARAARQPLSVMVFDIDGFKHYNDTYGHSAGDEILIETVKLLKSVIRPSDRVCRVGGDEFAVIFYEPKGPRTSQSKPLESVYQIAKRFQQQICGHRFPKLGKEALGTLTVSGGLASFPWDGHDADSLLEQADQLAMESKRNGKNAMTLGPGAESICGCDSQN